MQGFSSNLYSYYLKPGTTEAYGNTGYDDWHQAKSIVKSSSPYQPDRYSLATPKVEAFVKDHFNCSSLGGASLEDQGSSTSAGV